MTETINTFLKRNFFFTKLNPKRMEHLQDQEVTLPELYFSIIDVFGFFMKKLTICFRIQ